MHITRLFTVLLATASLGGISLIAPAQTITFVPLYTFNGDSENDRFGESVGGVGDVNGDGTPDLIVGAPWDGNNGNRSGIARVFSGSDGSVLYNFDGDAGYELGSSVSGVGDVNGDGTPDLIAGAPRSSSARVFSGSDGSVLYTFNGDSGEQFGYSVSGAGDVNGDGTTDLIVGAMGSALVFSGHDGSVLYTFNGDGSGSSFGWSVSGAGDVNGDGFADLIVGAPFDTNGGSEYDGSARVFSGSDGSVLYKFNGDNVSGDLLGVSVSSAGDVNGDGFADLIVGASHASNRGIENGYARVLSGSDGSVLYSVDGSSGDKFGTSVSGAGDVNGDGVDDLIVGAFDSRNDGVYSGSARVLSGSDGSVLYTFDGDSGGDLFGISVSCAGDVNGDGIDDFIVGALTGGANGGGYARVFVSQISPNCLLGDSDLSGTVNFLDISMFIRILCCGSYQCESDCNEDGIIDFLDIAPFIAILSGP